MPKEGLEKFVFVWQFMYKAELQKWLMIMWTETETDTVDLSLLQ